MEPTATLSAKKYDLMQKINLCGTFLLTKACVAHPENSANPYVLTISPPANMNPHGWAHAAYTLSKYGMTLLSLGAAAESVDAGTGMNCLWPQTYIVTAAVASMADGDKLAGSSRSRNHGRRRRRHQLSPPPGSHRQPFTRGR